MLLVETMKRVYTSLFPVGGKLKIGRYILVAWNPMAMQILKGKNSHPHSPYPIVRERVSVSSIQKKSPRLQSIKIKSISSKKARNIEQSCLPLRNFPKNTCAGGSSLIKVVLLILQDFSN